MDEKTDRAALGPGGEYVARLAGEGDLRSIMNLLNRYGVPSGATNADKDTIVHIDPLLPPNAYREVNVRFQLYNFSEEFVMLERAGTLDGLLGVKLSDFGIEVMHLGLVVVRRDCPVTSELLQYMAANVAEIALTRPTKFRLTVSAGAPYLQELVAIATAAGFLPEYRAEDELGWGKAVLAYARTVAAA